jgi:hypothetical protein
MLSQRSLRPKDGLPEDKSHQARGIIERKRGNVIGTAACGPVIIITLGRCRIPNDAHNKHQEGSRSHPDDYCLSREFFLSWVIGRRIKRLYFVT